VTVGKFAPSPADSRTHSQPSNLSLVVSVDSSRRRCPQPVTVGTRRVARVKLVGQKARRGLMSSPWSLEVVAGGRVSLVAGGLVSACELSSAWLSSALGVGRLILRVL